uniref:Transmembrane protein n=1 Tax=Steinernema glaseri TaxID=37863 RepID=A0A1I7ZYR3_9BILA
MERPMFPSYQEGPANLSTLLWLVASTSFFIATFSATFCLKQKATPELIVPVSRASVPEHSKQIPKKKHSPVARKSTRRQKSACREPSSEEENQMETSGPAAKVEPTEQLTLNHESSADDYTTQTTGDTRETQVSTCKTISQGCPTRLPVTSLVTARASEATPFLTRSSPERDKRKTKEERTLGAPTETTTRSSNL